MMDIPCALCVEEGGWRLTRDGRQWPAREATPPYTAAQGWGWVPMCAAHGREWSDRTWNGRRPAISEALKASPRPPLDTAATIASDVASVVRSVAPDDDPEVGSLEDLTL